MPLGTLFPLGIELKNGGSISNDGGFGVLFTVGFTSFSKTASFCVRRLS